MIWMKKRRLWYTRLALSPSLRPQLQPQKLMTTTPGTLPSSPSSHLWDWSAWSSWWSLSPRRSQPPGHLPLWLPTRPVKWTSKTWTPLPTLVRPSSTMSQSLRNEEPLNDHPVYLTYFSLLNLAQLKESLKSFSFTESMIDINLYPTKITNWWRIIERLLYYSKESRKIKGEKESINKGSNGKSEN